MPILAVPNLAGASLAWRQPGRCTCPVPAWSAPIVRCLPGLRKSVRRRLSNAKPDWYVNLAGANLSNASLACANLERRRPGRCRSVRMPICLMPICPTPSERRKPGLTQTWSMPICPVRICPTPS